MVRFQIGGGQRGYQSAPSAGLEPEERKFAVGGPGSAVPRVPPSRPGRAAFMGEECLVGAICVHHVFLVDVIGPESNPAAVGRPDWVYSAVDIAQSGPVGAIGIHHVYLETVFESDLAPIG